MDDFQWQVLNTAAKRGYYGASREDLFSNIRGVRYKELEEAVRVLERDGFVEVEWTGPNKFVVNITEKGSEMVKSKYKERLAEYEKRIEEQKAAAAPEEPEALFQCGNCNALVSEDATECPKCGAMLVDSEKETEDQEAVADAQEPDTLFQCGNCDALVSKDAKECPKCGAKLED
ncbi:MAG: hypothetical protein KAU99_04475 [Thermoplasmata archaeon]|nr:hypothetical protein [Thermoplasmata archaeon]